MLEPALHMSERIKQTFERRGLTFEATMEIDVAAAIELVFDFVSAEDVLPKVLTGYGLLPPVERTSGNTGPWDRPGSSRTVHLADGNSHLHNGVAVMSSWLWERDVASHRRAGAVWEARNFFCTGAVQSGQ